MTDTESPAPPLQAEPALPSELTGLNARTARRQKLLMGTLGAIALIGGSWFILGGDDKARSGDPGAAQTIETAGLVNRDLASREFVATYTCSPLPCREPAPQTIFLHAVPVAELLAEGTNGQRKEP